MDGQAIFGGPGLFQEELHGFVSSGLGDDSDKIGLNGELPMSPVCDHEELDDPGATEVDDGVQGGADGIVVFFPLFAFWLSLFLALKTTS